MKTAKLSEGNYLAYGSGQCENCQTFVTTARLDAEHTESDRRFIKG